MDATDNLVIDDLLNGESSMEIIGIAYSIPMPVPLLARAVPAGFPSPATTSSRMRSTFSGC